MGCMRGILIPAGVQGSPKCPDQLWGPPRLTVPWVLRVLSLGLKWPRHEVGHSFPSSAEIKIEYSYTYIPLDAFKMNFTLYIPRHETNIVCL